MKLYVKAKFNYLDVVLNHPDLSNELKKAIMLLYIFLKKCL